MGQKITALKLQKKNKERVSVYLDGEYGFGLSRIVAAWLQVGQVLDDEKIHSLQAADVIESAYQRALTFLNYRERSEQEVRQNLIKNNIPVDVIDQIATRLKDSGLVDDRRFARQWIENRDTFRPRSKRAITFELKQKGISDQDIEESLEQFDEESAAYRAASKQAVKLRKLDWPDFRQKLYSFLARRGFAYEISGPVVQKIWSDTHAGESYDLELDEELL